MGDFLKTWSETEYTNAGEVMQNVGKLQNSDSRNRLHIWGGVGKGHPG